MTILYTVLSCSPSAATSHSPLTARGNSPCPRLAFPLTLKERKHNAPLPSFHLLTPPVSQPTPATVAFALGPTLLPTSVVRKKSRMALVHRSSANRSRIAWLSFPFPVSFRTSAHRTFYCHFHFLQCLNKCSLVCVRYWHHPQAALSAFLVHSRYCPVRQCPVRSW